VGPGLPFTGLPGIASSFWSSTCFREQPQGRTTALGLVGSEMSEGWNDWRCGLEEVGFDADFILESLRLIMVATVLSAMLYAMTND
jgi:hypothetical protein